MVDSLPGRSDIFIDNGESRGADGVSYTQTLADCRSESGLSCSHGGIESDQSVSAYLFKKGPGRPFKVAESLYIYFGPSHYLT